MFIVFYVTIYITFFANNFVNLKKHYLCVCLYGKHLKTAIINNKKITTMKATIVKNDNFETIGFEVRTENTSNDVIFAWGISPSPMYYVKSVINEELEFIVFELVKLQSKHDTLQNFKSLFFGVIDDTEKANGKIPYNMKSIKDQIKQIENAMKGYIDSLVK